MPTYQFITLSSHWYLASHFQNSPSRQLHRLSLRSMSLHQSELPHRPNQASHQTELPIKEAPKHSNGAHQNPRDVFVRSRTGKSRTLSAVSSMTTCRAESRWTSVLIHDLQVDQGDRVDLNTDDIFTSRRLSHGKLIDALRLAIPNIIRC